MNTNTSTDDQRHATAEELAREFLAMVKTCGTHETMAWLFQPNVIRDALMRSRLGIKWEPEWDTLSEDEVLDSVAKAWAATNVGKVEAIRGKQDIYTRIAAATADKSWAAELLTALWRNNANSSSAGTFQVTVSYARNVWEYRTCDVSYNCRMELEIDPEDVREYIDDGDDSGLQRYIQSLVEDEQGEETSSEPSYGDEDTTGEEERDHDFGDHAGDGTSVYAIVERMMNREYPGREEEEEEEDDEDEGEDDDEDEDDED